MMKGRKKPLSLSLPLLLRRTRLRSRPKASGYSLTLGASAAGGFREGGGAEGLRAGEAEGIKRGQRHPAEVCLTDLAWDYPGV